MNKSINYLIDEPYFEKFVDQIFDYPKYKYVFHSIDFMKDSWLETVTEGILDSYEKGYHPRFTNQRNDEVTKEQVLTMVELNLKKIEQQIFLSILNLVGTKEEINKHDKQDYIFLIDKICVKKMNKSYSKQRNLDVLLELYKQVMDKPCKFPA